MDSGVQQFHQNESPCYTIGMLCLTPEQLDRLSDTFIRICEEHCVVADELKWTMIGGDGPHHEATFDLIKYVLDAGLRFHCIVVERASFNAIAKHGEEVAFYMAYTQLLANVVKAAGGEFLVTIDERPDKYPLRHEAMEIIGQRMLAKGGANGQIASVKPANSKDHHGIQTADLLAGAIWSSTAHAMGAKEPNRAKRDIISRVAALLGWPQGTFASKLVLETKSRLGRRNFWAGSG